VDPTSSTTSGGQYIAYYSNGWILAAEKSMNGNNRVDINMFPVSQNNVGYQWSTYSGDGAQLLRNALCYCGGGPLTFTLDVYNDSKFEVNQTNFAGNVTLPDFSSSLNSYIQNAPVSYTDAYGNNFVTIPVNVTSPGKGKVDCNKLDITYDYSTAIDANPSMGNLTNSVSDLQSTIQGTGNYTIPLAISSANAGKVKLSGLSITMHPPNHTPRIDSFFPATSTVINEDTTLDLGVNASDIYGNPISYQWSFDGAPVAGGVTNRLSHYFDFVSSGTHNVTVNVSNPISERTFKQMSWTITVLNVNRPPEITDFTPMTDPTISENTSQTFTVTATDPDQGDPLSYVWFLDGKVVAAATSNNFTYAADFFSTGQHAVKCIVSDSYNSTVTQSWLVNVLFVDVAPVIADFSPKTDPTITETNSWTFSVTPTDLNKNQTLTVSWFADDKAVFTGNPYTFTTDYNSAGTHKVKAIVSDGQLTASQAWTVTVLNLNRAPTAVLDSPADMSEYMQGDVIHFSAKSSTDADNDTLSFTWKEGGVNVSDQMEFDRAFSPGIHTLTVEVRDPSGGRSTASVTFRVRYVEISVVVGLDRLDVVAGNKIDVIVTMSNIGDANSTNLPLTMTVDGANIGSATIGNVTAGGAQKQPDTTS